MIVLAAVAAMIAAAHDAEPPAQGEDRVLEAQEPVGLDWSALAPPAELNPAYAARLLAEMDGEPTRPLFAIWEHGQLRPHHEEAARVSRHAQCSDIAARDAAVEAFGQSPDEVALRVFVVDSDLEVSSANAIRPEAWQTPVQTACYGIDLDTGEDVVFRQVGARMADGSVLAPCSAPPPCVPGAYYRVVVRELAGELWVENEEMIANVTELESGVCVEGPGL